MRTKSITVLFFVFTTLISITAWADNRIPAEGEWEGKGGSRTFTPAPPEASVEGNTVSIHFRSALSDLTVSIMDETGVIYETVISSHGNSNYTCELPWVGQPGNYHILMVHGTYGYLGGGFTIE